jgi:microcystin-dependent protein
VHQGQGPGLSQRFLGEPGGSQFVTLLQSEMPVHNHRVNVTGENGTQGSLTAGVVLATSVGGNLYQTNTSASLQQLNGQALAVAGGSLPHNNMQPYLVLLFIIAMQGVFPPRN